MHEPFTEVAEPNHKRRIWVGNTFNSCMSKKNTTQQECVPITNGHHKTPLVAPINEKYLQIFSSKHIRENRMKMCRRLCT